MKIKLLLTSAISILLMALSSCNLTNQPGTLSNIKYMAWQEDKYLWVSTNDQVVRWNIRSKKADTFENVFGRLFVDSKNLVWVFNSNRISYFDGQVWQHFTPDDGFVKGDVLSVTETDQYIWVGTRGLSRYNRQHESWDIVLQTSPGPTPTPVPQNITVEVLIEGIHAIAPENQTTMWLGTERGLTYLTPDSQQSWGNKDLETNGVRCLLESSNGEVWVCTEGGVGLWDGIQWVEFVEGLIDPFLIVRGEGKEVWVVTRESGVARWDGISWDNWTKSEGLAGERPTSLVVSTVDGDIWVGTKTGISRWSGKQWRTYTTLEGLTSEYVNVLFEDPTGTLWAGTFGGGVNYYDPSMDRWRPFLGK